MIKSLYLLLIVLPALSFMNPGGSEWELKQNKNGVAVYTKSVPGMSVKAVKSVATVNSTLSGIVALVLDVPSYNKWIYRCANAHVVKTESASQLVYYQETSVPWPASNRDLVCQLKISQDKKSGIVTIIVENAPGFEKEKSGKVRLQKYSEKMLLVPKGKNEVEVTTELALDPGGNIPSWMINLAVTDGPYQTSLGMSKVVKSGSYQGAHFPFIAER
jgi:hypothetical protein